MAPTEKEAALDIGDLYSFVRITVQSDKMRYMMSLFLNDVTHHRSAARVFPERLNDFLYKWGFIPLTENLATFRALTGMAVLVPSTPDACGYRTAVPGGSQKENESAKEIHKNWSTARQLARCPHAMQRTQPLCTPRGSSSGRAHNHSRHDTARLTP